MSISFETKRLIIRKPTLHDANDIYKNYTTDHEITKYLIWTPHKNVEESISWIKLCIDKYDENKSLVLIIENRVNNEAIGMIDFKIEKYKAIFGYVLGKQYWNQGIMTEAMRPVIDYVLNKPEIYRIYATHYLENEKSGRVMQKLGMQLEGILKKNTIYPNISNIPLDDKIYSIVKDC